MHRDQTLVIRWPSSPQGITLDEWLAFVAKSGVLQPTPPRTGINPFTKQPTEFKPAAGSAFFETAQGRCAIAYKNGNLVISNADEDATTILTNIARALGGVVERSPSQVVEPTQKTQSKRHEGEPMRIDLREAATKLQAFLAKAIKQYALKHEAPTSSAKHPQVTRLDLNFWLTDGGPAAPFVLLNIDTRPGSEPDGTWTHCEFATMEFPKWTSPLHAYLDGQEVELIGPDDTTTTFKAAKPEKLIGEFLVSVLKSARADGLFDTLPKAGRCELGVEASGGSFAWPSYKDRGKENLA